MAVKPTRSRFRKRATKKRMHPLKGTRRVAIIKNPVQSNSLIVKLPYDGGSIGTTVTTIMGSYQYKTNGIFDPDYTGTGHQPLGFDEYSGLYLNYRVIGVYYDILFHTSSFSAGVCGVFPHGTLAVPGLSALLELGGVTHVIISNGYSKRLRGYVSNPRLFGVTKTEYMSNTNFTASINGDPVKPGYFTVFWSPLDEATSMSFEIRPKLTYLVEFYGRRAMGQS